MAQKLLFIFQVLFEKLPGKFIYVGVAEKIGIAVSAVFYCIKCHGHPRFLQCSLKQFALMKRHSFVLISVNNKKWRVIFCDVNNRIGFLGFFKVILNWSANQL